MCGLPALRPACFNPRLRTGGDERAALQGHRQARVSIHASAREATGQHLRGKDVLAVSIHASAREATILRAGKWQCVCRFNPRLRTGGDRTRICPGWRIHTFQSTPPHGRRRRWAPCPAAPNKFQSTPPHGRRRVGFGIRTGGRKVSIHASAREATDAAVLVECEGDVSIHASAREATLPSVFPLLEPFLFQSTPPHGRRRVMKCTTAWRNCGVSIHASAREATIIFFLSLLSC